MRKTKSLDTQIKEAELKRVKLDNKSQEIRNKSSEIELKQDMKRAGMSVKPKAKPRLKPIKPIKKGKK